MATRTPSGLRTRIAYARTARAFLRRRRVPPVRPFGPAFSDTTMQPGEVASFATPLSHWFGPAGHRPDAILGIAGRETGRVAPRGQRATG